MVNLKEKTNINSSDFLAFVNSPGNNTTPGDILYANEVTLRKLGYTMDEILLLHPSDVGMPINTTNLKNEIIKLFDEKTVSYDMIFFTKSNQVILTNIEARLIEFNSNKAVLTTAREISDHNYIKNIVIKCNKELESTLTQVKETKEQLFQQEKLAVIGQMAAGVAHEINNPLGYISSNIETAHTYFSKIEKLLNLYDNLFSKLFSISGNELYTETNKITDLKTQTNMDFIIHDIKELYKDIDDGLKKISEIVNSLKTFSRVDPSLEFKEYDLNKGIKDSLMIARNEIKYYAHVTESLGTLPNIMASGNRINEVLLNIILNSCYAIKDKETDEKGLIKITTTAENNYVICQIEDNGTGIEKQHLNRIFDPFFTTKPVGQGTGLGLSIAYDIILNKHYGKIYAESTPGIGTKITIKLPITN